MINLKIAQNEFKKYAQNYDMTLDGIERKYHHSFRVMNISMQIAKSLNLDEEQINLATLIGLLHDIARFEEFTRYRGFSLEHEFDHGDYAVEILKKNNYIRKFIETDKYDNLIFTAIKYHNKFKIEEGLDENTLLHCKIIRDADKLDIFLEADKLFWQKPEEVNLIENSEIFDSYFDQFMNKQPICRIPGQTVLDDIIACIAFIFDLNFKYSFEKTKKENYVNNILNRFDFKIQDTINKVSKIKEISNNYLDEKIV